MENKKGDLKRNENKLLPYPPESLVPRNGKRAE